MEEIRRKPLIADRVVLIGDEVIPQSVLQDLLDEHLQVFMREPDPSLWPTEMQHLVQYLSSEERLGYAVAKVLSSHDSLVKPAVAAWTEAGLRDLAEDQDLTDERREALIQAMVKHLELLIRESLKKPSPGGGEHD